MGTPLDTGSPAQPVATRPGDFKRHPKTGAPYVTDPTKTREPQGKKADLIAKCEARGIEVPAKVTVAQLKDLLGPEMAMSMYGRPSSLGKQIENATNLQKWSERATALGLFLDPDLFAELRHLDPDALTLDDNDARSVLDAAVVKAKARAQAGIAAERGTHTHALTEDFDTEADWIERARSGEDLGIPTDVQAALVEAWERMLDANDLEILAVETPVVDDAWRQAGTLDRIARLRKGLCFILPGGELITLEAGTVIVLDVKTGKLRNNRGIVSYWHGYAVQIASYAQSVPYDPPTGMRGEWEWTIDQRWALIAHLDVLSALDGAATCRLVLVDLAAGREAGERCVWARQWEQRTDVFSMIADNDDTCVTVEVNPTEEQPDDPALELANEIGEWGGELKKLLAVEWPAGVPTPASVRRGEATWSANNIERIQTAMNEIVGPFDDPPSQPQPMRPATNESDVPPARIDDGDHIDDEALAQILADIKASPARVLINGWLHEASDAGCSWQPRLTKRVRQYEITRAAFHLASMVGEREPDADDEFDELVRTALATAIESDQPLMPINPIGVTLGHLTIAEAVAVASLAQSIWEMKTVLTFSDQGRMVLTDAAATSAA